MSHLPIKGQQGTRTKSGFRTLGEEIQFAMNGGFLASKADLDYRSKRRSVTFLLEAPDFAIIETEAKRRGLSVSAFMKRAVVALAARLEEGIKK